MKWIKESKRLFLIKKQIEEDKATKTKIYFNMLEGTEQEGEKEVKKEMQVNGTYSEN
jgi:hypothetical protein